jgi:hypothetical protein
MNFSEVGPSFRSVQPATELIALALLAPDVARLNLRALLLSNPDYFGKITGSTFKAVLKIERDTTFESIAGIHYSPQDETLQATIHLNRSIGYSGANCGNASQEFARFYLSYDEGSTWKDQGLQAVNVYDIKGPKPSRFTVTSDIHPARTFCFMKNLPTVRVILSWNFAPPADAPDWAPVWGEVLDRKVEINGAGLETDICSDVQGDAPRLKTNSTDGEAMMHSAILERTVEASRLKVLGLTELSEHYSVPIYPFSQKVSRAS